MTRLMRDVTKGQWQRSTYSQACTKLKFIFDTVNTENCYCAPMAISSDILLQLILLVLLAANVWILIYDDKVPHCLHLHKEVESDQSSNCDRFSVLTPDKCASVLKGVDSRQGLVLGKRRENKVLLTLAVAVWEDHMNNIQPFLSSVIKHVTPEDSNDITIVISVTPKHIEVVTKLLKEQFFSHLDSGLVHLISPSEGYTKVFTKRPPLGNRNLKDFSKDFADKMIDFNKNIGFLLYYGTHLSEYTLHLNDKSMVTERFLPVVKQHIDHYKNGTHFALTFNGMWLMHSSAMHNLNEFYAMFGNHATPALMQKYLSVRQSHNILVDTQSETFSLKSIECKRPKSSLKTNMLGYKRPFALFWAATPKNNDYLQITFDDSIKLSNVQIVAGTPIFADLPKMALLKACAATVDKKLCNTSSCYQVTTLGDPLQNIMGLENIIGFHVKCLRLEFTEEAEKWAMIRDIAACMQ